MVSVWLLVECRIHDHRPGEDDVGGEIMHDRLARVFGICKDVQSTSGGKPALHEFDQLSCEYRSLAVLALRTAFLRAIEAKQEWNGQPLSRVPWKRNPKCSDHPVVPKREDRLATLGRSTPVGRTVRVVVHRRSEDVRSALVAQSVIQDQCDLLGHEGQQQSKQRFADRVGGPPSLREESVDRGVMLARGNNS